MKEYIIETILSNMEYDNFDYSIIEKNGKTIIECDGVEIIIKTKYMKGI